MWLVSIQTLCAVNSLSPSCRRPVIWMYGLCWDYTIAHWMDWSALLSLPLETIDWSALVHFVNHLYDVPPDNKVHGANMGPIWGRQDPSGPHVGPMNFAIWAYKTWVCWWLVVLSHLPASCGLPVIKARMSFERFESKLCVKKISSFNVWVEHLCGISSAMCPCIEICVFHSVVTVWELLV